MVPTPWCPVPNPSEKSVTPSADTLVPQTVNTDAEIDKVPNFAATSAPPPPPHTQPVSMVPPSWPCLLGPNEKLTAQATHQQSIIRLKHST